MATVGRVLWVMVVTAVLFVVLALGVFPTRTLLDQRAIRADTEAQLASLDQEIAELSDRVERLQTPEEIERLAREQYFMVREGEEPYVIVSSQPATVPVPPGWPFHRIETS